MTGESVQAMLASNLRRLRIARRLSLSELARATAMSKATLSGIEHGRGNPTVDTLVALAGALHVSMVELLAQAPLGEVRIVRASQAGHGPPDGDNGSQIARRALERVKLDGALDISELTLPAHHVHAVQPRASGSRSAVLVLRGKLIAGPVERISELAVGDYASFPSDAANLYETRRGAARALVLVCTPA